MELLLTILMLLVFLLVSNIISHYIPFIPTALIQVGLGVIIAFIYPGANIEIETEWFLLVFIAPLLYNDGRHYPREKFWQMRAPILGNAVVLVLITTLGGGYFIHWLIPSIPLAAAFALAAILSPTDPVAVNGIAKRTHIPEDVLNLVKGESLINDASGLIAFKYAVAAVVTGEFFLGTAALDFAYKFALGLLVGIALGFLSSWLKYILHRRGVGDVVFYSLLEILMPFIIFIAAEEALHASGVVAVVFAGISHSLINDRIGNTMAEENLTTEHVWSVFGFTLNGIVFLILGMLLPSSMSIVVEDPNISNFIALGYAIAIYVIIMLIRFLWSHLFALFNYRRCERIKNVRSKGRKKEGLPPKVRDSLMLSFMGVRGSVTMAGVLSIPFWTMGGEPFPERPLIIFLCAAVIVASLVSATVFMPLLSQKKVDADKEGNGFRMLRAKRRIILSAIDAVKLEITRDNELVANQVIREFKMWLENLEHEQSPEEVTRHREIVRKLRLRGLKAERAYLETLGKSSSIDTETFEDFECLLSQREEILLSDAPMSIRHILRITFRKWRRSIRRAGKDPNECKSEALLDIRAASLQSAIDSLEKLSQKESYPGRMVKEVVADYQTMLSTISSYAPLTTEKRNEQRIELKVKAIDAERFEMRRMYEEGEISSEQMKELRRFINHNESMVLYEYTG